MLLLLALWAVGIYVVGPEGDFPLNDDWAYARGVRSFVEEGKLELDTWPAMSLITQVGLGIGYAELFGFSFEVLRWSTLINALLCLWMLYYLLLRFTQAGVALFSSVLLLGSPLFFSLSFTFMTEVHFLFFLLATTLLFFRYAETSRYVYLLLAAIGSVLATLLRQPGLLLPLSCGIVLLYRERSLLRAVLALLPFVVSFAALKGYYYWTEINYPELFRVGGFSDLVASLTTRTWQQYVPGTFNMLLAPGLFLLPLVLLLLKGVMGLRKRLVGIAVGGAAVMATLIIAYPRAFPVGNLLYNLGLGPRLLKGYYGRPMAPSISEFWWGTLDFIALAGLLGIALLILRAAPDYGSPWKTRPRDDGGARKRWMVALFCLSSIGISILIKFPFDRHTVPLLPFIAVLIVPRRVVYRPLTTALAITTLLLYGGFSWVATHDYLTWNRMRKQAVDDLTEVDRVPPTFVDAGFEINGWRQAGPEGGWSSHKSWWFVTEDDYALSFTPLHGYDWYKTYRYQTLYSTAPSDLYVLKRSEVSRIDSSEYPIALDFDSVNVTNTYYQSSHPMVTASGTDLVSTVVARSGARSCKLPLSSINYGPSVKLFDPLPASRFMVSFWQYPQGPPALVLGRLDYSSHQLTQIEKARVLQRTSDGWQRVTAVFGVPAYRGKNRMVFTIGNPGSTSVYIDDWQIDRMAASLPAQ